MKKNSKMKKRTKSKKTKPKIKANYKIKRSIINVNAPEKGTFSNLSGIKFIFLFFYNYPPDLCIFFSVLLIPI